MKDKNRVIALLVLGHSQKKVAAMVGMSASQISRWKRDPKFMARLEQAWDRQRNRIEYRLGAAADKGIKVLTTEMAVAAEAKDRIRAASVVVGTHVRAVGNRIKPPATAAGPVFVFPPGTNVALFPPKPDPAAVAVVVQPLPLPAGSPAATPSQSPETDALTVESGAAAAAGAESKETE